MSMSTEHKIKKLYRKTNKYFEKQEETYERVDDVNIFRSKNVAEIAKKILIHKKSFISKVI